MISGKIKTLLLVDDDILIATMEQKDLEDYGYKVILAHSGEEAIEVFHTNLNIDLIIMDIDLGDGMDGTEAADIILKDREIPVLFMSSHTEPDIVEKTEKITSYGYVVKNSGITVLDASIKMAFKLFDAKMKEQAKEVALRESERKFHQERDFSELIINTTSAILLLLDKEGKILKINPYMEKLSGYKLEEVKGKDWFTTFLPECDYDKIRKLFKKAIGKENTKGKISPILTKDKNEILIEWYDDTLIDKNGNVIGLLCFGIDITKRKQAEELLNEKTMLLDNIVNRATNNSIITTDLEMRITSYNSLAEEYFGYTASEVIGKTVFDMHFMEKVEQGRLERAIEIVKKTNEYKYLVTQELETGKRVLSSRVTGLLDSAKNHVGYALFTTNITDAVLAEERLIQREEYLSALNRAKEILLKPKSEDTFQQFVNILGPASNASRTYIFINHRNENNELLMSQKAEYCRKGIKYEIDNSDLQNLKYDDYFPRWKKILSKGKLISGKIIEFPQTEKEFLEAQGIKSILIIPIILKKEFIGFIGFDNCVSEKEWDKAEQDFLKAAANDLAQFIDRNKVQEQLKYEYNRFQMTMDALDAVVYVADMETYELLFSNKKCTDIFGDHIGEKCYNIAQKNQTKPCTFCTNHLLLDKKGKPRKPYVWEFQNTITKQWYQCRDQAIKWIDGRLVRIEINTDITERKIAEESLIASQKEYIKLFEDNPISLWNEDFSEVIKLLNDIKSKGVTDFKEYFEKNPDFVIKCANSIKITNINQATLDLFKYKSKNELINNLTNTFNEKSIETYKNQLVVLAQGEKQFSDETEYVCSTGEIISTIVDFRQITDFKNVIFTITDITERKQAEEALLQREDYLTALNRAKEILLKPKSEDTFQQFVNILGPASNASRTYIFIKHRNENRELLMSQKAEYCRKGIKHEIDNPDLQNLKYDDYFSRWTKILSKGKLISGKIIEFPQTEKEFLEAQGIKSILIIPIILKKEFIGFIGFDNCVSEKEWDKAEQDFLKTAANDLAQIIDRNRVQEQLKLEYNRFQTTMDALDAVVYVADMETYELLFLNEQGKKLLGEKIGGKCYTTLQKGQTKPCEFCTNHLLLDKKGKPRKPYVWEFQNTITKQWYQCRDQAIKWIDGRLVRIEINTDITGRKKAEEELQESKEFAENLLETAKSIVVTLDAKANISTFNQYAEELTGYLKEEVLGKNWFDLFILEEDKKNFPKVFKKALESISEVSQYENPIITKSGDIRTIRWSNSLISDNAGKTDGLLCIGVDITDRIKTEQALKKSEEKFRNLFNESPVSLIEEDWSKAKKLLEGLKSDGITISREYFDNNPDLFAKCCDKVKNLNVNKATLNLFKYKNKIEYVKNSFKILNDKSLETIKDVLVAIANDEKSFIQESELLDSNGKIIQIIVQFQNINNYKNIVFSKIDITEQKESEKRLEQEIIERKKGQEKIQELLTEKEIILREVHHRIKNNMMTLKTLLKLQSRDMEIPEVTTAFQDAIGRISSMGILYDKLYQNKNYQEVSTQQYFSALIDEIYQMFSNSKPVSIEKQIEDFKLESKIVLPFGIILNELITNSMKYAFPENNNNLIQISVKKIKTNVILIYKDNGIGLSEIDTKSNKGFGLKLIELLVKQLHGNLLIENENGAKFTIEFEK